MQTSLNQRFRCFHEEEKCFIDGTDLNCTLEQNSLEAEMEHKEGRGTESHEKQNSFLRYSIYFHSVRHEILNR